MTSICATIPKEYKEWLQKKVKIHDYANISHGITVLIRNEMRNEGLLKDE